MYKNELRFHLNDYWKAIKEIEQQETYAASIVEKWKERHDIWCEAIKYGIDPEKMEIYAKRAKLIRLYESGALNSWPAFRKKLPRS